jgi:hypothetical protein
MPLRIPKQESPKRGSKTPNLSSCGWGRFWRECEPHADFPAPVPCDCHRSIPAILRDPVVRSLLRAQSHEWLGSACQTVPHRFAPPGTDMDLAKRQNEMELQLQSLPHFRRGSFWAVSVNHGFVQNRLAAIAHPMVGSDRLEASEVPIFSLRRIQARPRRTSAPSNTRDLGRPPSI